VRLLAAQVLVVLIGAVTAWVVALAVGPPLFHDHLSRVQGGAAAQQLLHAEEAFRSATAIAVTVALGASLAAGLAASLYATRRIGRSVRSVADAAATVATGDYATRLPPPRLGSEFDVLAASFNRMAGQLQSVETTRRRLLADLAHEIRTPVATLDAYLEGVEDGVTALDPDTLAMLRDQTHRLTRLAEDIGAVSRAEEHCLPLDLRPLPPAVLVDQAALAARPRFADKGVRLVTEVAGNLPVVLGDADRLGQVLGNVLDNALRHTPVGGTVTLIARAVADGVELAVVDTGEGIPAEHVDRVMERFYRVDTARDRERGGSGIGLSISRAIVLAHRGRIAVSSPGVGAGTVVTVWLPA
jgi:signal transduction histidine kinase